MSLINENFLRLHKSYLFSDIARKVKDFKEKNPGVRVVSLGIGDVTRPLPASAITAMHKAVDEMCRAETFRGYGPEQGYDFLRKAIVKTDFIERGVTIDIDEVFVSDGAKSDCGNIGDLFNADCKVGLTDPVYPVYVDSNIMGGRFAISHFPVTSENDFVPSLPSEKIDLIYLCYPNNPTGTVLTGEQLQKWVEYALEHKSVILFDAAYEAYIRQPDIPHSIYEIDGAKKVAIELRSFSKTAGFTGLRCGYTVVPKDLVITTDNGTKIGLNQLWNRRQCTKFNGVSYITQRAAEAIYTPQGQAEIRETTDYYMDNANYMKQELLNMGYNVCGGQNAPYLWLRVPEGESSWSFFDRMLHELAIVTTPGVGFGPNGEGYVRLTSFGWKEDCIEAINRIKNWKNL